MSMKYSNDTIGNRTRDLLTCSAVPLLNAPPRAPKWCSTTHYEPWYIVLAARYRSVGPGIENRSGREFLHPSRPVSGPTQTTLTRQRARSVRVILLRRQRVQRAKEILVMLNKEWSSIWSYLQHYAPIPTFILRMLANTDTRDRHGIQNG